MNCVKVEHKIKILHTFYYISMYLCTTYNSSYLGQLHLLSLSLFLFVNLSINEHDGNGDKWYSRELHRPCQR